MPEDRTAALLHRVGARVRRRRQVLGLRIKDLAERAGLSARFVSDVEKGKGNVAVGRLDDLDVLGKPQTYLGKRVIRKIQAQMLL